MAHHQRGLTLVELLVGVVLTGAAAAIACQLLLAVERVTDAEGVRGELEAALRTAALVTGNELRQLTPASVGASDAGGDILAITDSSISYRAVRAYYTVCAAPTSATSITVDRSVPSAFATEFRAPSTSDSLLLFWEGDPARADDDRWLALPITAVSTANGSCLVSWDSAPHPGYTFALGTPGIPASIGLAGVSSGAPVRTFESATLRSYLSGGQRWLGLDLGHAGVQPVAGPLRSARDAPGFALRYLDSLGGTLPPIAASIPGIRAIRAELRAVGQRAVASSGRARVPIGDSLFPFIYLRNGTPR